MHTLKFKIQYCPLAELMIYLVVGLMTLFPLWAYSIWPINHEGLSFFSRLHVYQQHFQAGDFLPIWSSLDNHGFGSPQPLFYHKLFYFVSTAFLYVFSGNLKVALITAVCFFLIVGAWGTRRLVLEIGGSSFAAFCGGLMMLLANYTVTDWLVRGALAETSAAMLVPWALAYFQRVTQTSQVGWKLAFFLTLIFLSHSVICFYLLIFFTLTLLLLLIIGQVNKTIFKPIPIVISCGIFAFANAPYFLTYQFFKKNYDLSRILKEFEPAKKFLPFKNYLFNTEFSWSGQNMTVELDFALCVITVLSVLVLAYKLLNSSLRDAIISKVKILLPLTIIFICCLLLQLRASEIFYELVPGAKYLQFPWRLLCILTPILIVYACYLPNTAFIQKRWASALQAMGVLAMIAMCGVRYDFPTIGNESYPDVFNISGTFSFFDEYKPINLSDMVAPEKIIDEAKVLGCSITRLDGPLGEKLEHRFQVSCEHDASISFPIVASSLHRVRITNTAGMVSKDCELNVQRPTLCGVSLPAGSSEVTIQMPRMSYIVKPNK